jgi:hypothetical protein
MGWGPAVSMQSDRHNTGSKLAGQERRKGELRAAAESIAEFAREFRSRFADADHQKRKEMIQRCLGGIVVDRTAKVARCCFRPMPLVGDTAVEIIEGIENAKGIPELPISLRKVAVPGTGTDDVANNRTPGSWWILREMPIQRRTRRPEIGDTDPHDVYPHPKSLANQHFVQYISGTDIGA